MRNNRDSIGSQQFLSKLKGEYKQIDKALFQIQSTYKTNIEAQQFYIDIAQKKKKNIDSKFIKEIYAMFTENKANQICFEKEFASISANFNQRLLQRFYARVIEMGLRKISYFWMNEKQLSFLSPMMVSFTKEISNCYKKIDKLKTLETHLQILKLLFQENCKIEEMIYAKLIDDGYLLSMDEFYRINGVGLVGDESYSRKNSFSSDEENELNQNQDDSYEQVSSNAHSRRESAVKTKRNRMNFQRSKSQRVRITLKAQENDKIKIKRMMEFMISSIKNDLAQKKPRKVSKLQVIKQQSAQCQLNSNAFKNEQNQNIRDFNNKTHRKTEKNDIFKVTNEKSQIQKQESIGLMNYFSNQFKFTVNQINDVDLDYFSEFLGSNPLMKAPVLLSSGRNQINIDSSQSLEKMRENKKRGKLMDIVMQQKMNENFQGFEHEIKEAFKKKGHLFRSGSKLSLKSAPGVCISFCSKGSSNFKDENSQMQRSKKFTFQTHFKNQNLFENQFILNEISPLMKNQQKILQFRESKFNHFLFQTHEDDETHFPFRNQAEKKNTKRSKKRRLQVLTEVAKFSMEQTDGTATQKNKTCRQSQLSQSANQSTERSGRKLFKNSVTLLSSQQKDRAHKLKNSRIYTVFDRNRRKIIQIR